MKAEKKIYNSIDLDPSKDWLIYDPFEEGNRKYKDANSVIYGKAGHGMAYTEKELFEKMRAEGIEVFRIVDRTALERFARNHPGLRGESIEFPVRYIEFYDPAKNKLVQRCWKCEKSRVIVYPPGMIDICCTVPEGAPQMVARIYPNGSLKTTAKIHGMSISATIDTMHLFHPDV